MKIVSKFLVLVACLPASPLAADSFTVSAQIDGHSQLIIQPDQVCWQHIRFARPGRHLGNHPTLLNAYSWYPHWPDSNDSDPGRSASQPVVATISTNPITLTKEAGRGSVSIVQQPDSTNGFTLVIDFDDAFDGPDDYTVVISGVSIVVLPQLTAQVASIEICWPTESNRLYQLQYCSALTSNLWFDLAPAVRGYGTNASFVDFVLGQPRRFYRVVPVP